MSDNEGNLIIHVTGNLVQLYLFNLNFSMQLE